jgi:hypothetical protein
MAVWNDLAVALLVVLNAVVLAWLVIGEIRAALRAADGRGAAPSEQQETEALLRTPLEPGDGTGLPEAAADCRSAGLAPLLRRGR